MELFAVVLGFAVVSAGAGVGAGFGITLVEAIIRATKRAALRPTVPANAR